MRGDTMISSASSGTSFQIDRTTLRRVARTIHEAATKRGRDENLKEGGGQPWKPFPSEVRPMPIGPLCGPNTMLGTTMNDAKTIKLPPLPTAWMRCATFVVEG